MAQANAPNIFAGNVRANCLSEGPDIELLIRNNSKIAAYILRSGLLKLREPAVMKETDTMPVVSGCRVDTRVTGSYRIQLDQRQNRCRSTYFFTSGGYFFRSFSIALLIFFAAFLVWHLGQ